MFFLHCLLFSNLVRKCCWVCTFFFVLNKCVFFFRVRPSKTPIYQGVESRKRTREDGGGPISEVKKFLFDKILM